MFCGLLMTPVKTKAHNFNLIFSTWKLLLLAETIIGDVVNARLQLVHAVWRHGDRIPLTTFPTDSLGPDAWPYPLGELTPLGMRQERDLGKYVLHRYSSFLNQSYSAFEVYVRSTDYNRTICSAQAKLAGMYPPTVAERFDESLAWQPIPVHVVPRPQDYVVWMDRECPTADNEYFNEVQHSPEVLAIMNENKNLLDFVREQSGEPLPVLHYMWHVFDPLFTQKLYNKTWPKWMNESVFQQIDKLHELSKLYYYHTPTIRRFRGGPLLGEIVGRMESKLNGSLDHRFKYYGYSGHDTTLIGLLENLGAYHVTSRIPPYASIMFFELHADEDLGTDIVKVFYRAGGTSGEPVSVPISWCPQPCKFSDFKANSAGRWPEDWFAECGLRTTASEDSGTTERLTGAVVALSLSLMLVLVLIGYAFFRGWTCNRRHMEL